MTRPEAASAAAHSPALDRSELREAIREEYRSVALEPDRGFHFHTGRRLATLLEYPEEWLRGIPEVAIESFAGTGNPFRPGLPRRGERVVDIGCGAGLDTLVAATAVGAEGRVIGIDMTPAMLEKARAAAAAAGAAQVEVRAGYAEELPVADGWADLLISNGVLNLVPDKPAALTEMARVLRPGGRLQIADIVVQRPVSARAREDIALWTG